MAKTYQYCVAENWGKGFIDHDESWRITFKGYPGNVWQVPAHNKDGNLWIAKVAGAIKTKDEAQALVDAEIQAVQAAWDALPAEEKTDDNPRPADITIEE
jgi:hypothetical protein|tara:strand:+ start:574 stop:873 length:300 start_codon:yes stop_codon:yes gene_type:complete